MFSKALFKQSCKANGTMWAIITFAVCFMLACVMLISGGGNISKVKDAIEDTIITKEIDSQIKKRAINYYNNSSDGLKEFDVRFTADATDTLSYLKWLSLMPERDGFSSDEEYASAFGVWQSAMPVMKTATGKAYVKSVTEWQAEMPEQGDFSNTEDYLAAMTEWRKKSPATQESAVKAAYVGAANEVKRYVLDKASAINPAWTELSVEGQEMLGSVMYVLNPDGMFDDFYMKYENAVPKDYEFMPLINHIAEGDAEEYVSGEERNGYRLNRAKKCSEIFLAGNMTEEKNVNKILAELASFGVTKEKYDTFGYNYENLKHSAGTTIITYEGRIDYENSLLKEKYENGEFKSEEEYLSAVNKALESLTGEISGSLLSSLPEEVADALQEIGKADLYTLIVGSIFYKLAGLLLPIIYMIMASNNLIAGQVDSGSMAYVLSTSTKRKTVVFTQAVYLIGSLFAMFCLSTVTGCVCLAIVKAEVDLTYGKLILLNVGAFLVLFALSGLCFLTSCFFDRSKRSMALGGGLSIFALVAAMLGLFGSPVIPSVVRLEALNYFNYTTIISLFDVVSIMESGVTFIWKFAILFALGVTGYVLGSLKFTKKDLPL